MKAHSAASSWTLIAMLAFQVLEGTSEATSRLDQQQPIIDMNVGGTAIGGGSEQKLAQVVTAGLSGFLTEVVIPGNTLISFFRPLPLSGAWLSPLPSS